MKRFALPPEQSSWLASTIERNRKYAGMRMMADEPKPDDDPKPDDPPKDDPKPDDDKLGEGGKKALEAERTRAKAAEDAARALKGEFDGFKDAMSEFLGIKPKSDDDGADALVAIKEQVAAMQRESAVLKLANAHQITDEGDLTILASATDAEQMKKLAERLAPKEQDRDATSRRPKPDRTQGGGDGNNSQSRGGSVSQVMADRAAARAAKTTSNV